MPSKSLSSLKFAACLPVLLICSTNSFAQQGERVTRLAERVPSATNETRTDAAPPAAAALAPASDPYGFLPILNAYRAAAGLPAVAFDSNLSAWASQNNAAQCRRGLGHHVNPNCFQNSAWNCANSWEVAQTWMNSRGHRANMLSPHITRVGVAYGPGPYWTMNAR